jgi:NTE family protein
MRRLLWRLRPPVLALGGGGARGFGHLGVLEVIDEWRLPVRGIVGTSMGAVVGAMYLAYGSADAAVTRWREAIAAGLVPPVRPMRRLPDAGSREHPLLQVARRFRNQLVVAFAINRATVLDDDDLERAFDYLIPETSVEDLRRPFRAVATDLETGREVRLGRGPLRRVMMATSAIPGLLPAVTIDDFRLVDGGVVAEVPAAAASELGWPTVAVDTSMDLPPLTDEDLVLDTMIRTQMMTAGLLRRQQLKRARVVIRPEVGHATWADWHLFESLVDAGRAAASKLLGSPPGSSPVLGT